MGDIVSVIYNAPVKLISTKKEKTKENPNKDNPSKANSPPDQDFQKRDLEKDKIIFNNYMHCFFDQCARELGNRDFDEYRAMNAEDGGNYKDIPDWRIEPCLEYYNEKDEPTN